MGRGRGIIKHDYVNATVGVLESVNVQTSMLTISIWDDLDADYVHALVKVRGGWIHDAMMLVDSCVAVIDGKIYRVREA